MIFQHTNCPKYQALTRENTNTGRWYNIPTGEKYASITNVLGYGDKPWLDAWIRNIGKEKAEAEKNRCADRGTAVHLMAERYLNNDPNVTKDQSKFDIQLFNKLSYSLDKINNIRAQEIPMYSRQLQIAGTCDCVAEYNGILSIIDFKTSTKIKTKDMVTDYFMQAAGYSIMYFEMFNVYINQGVIMIATEKGLFPTVFTINIEDYIEPLCEKINKFYDDISKVS